MSNRKMEIKRPYLKDVIFLPNLLAQKTQTAKMICTGKKWDASGVKMEKTFVNYHYTLEELWDCCLIIDSWITQQLFCRANVLSKNKRHTWKFLLMKFLPLHWFKKFKNQGQELVSHPMQNFNTFNDNHSSRVMQINVYHQ